MNKKDIVVATITWARDESEAQLLQESLQQLAELDIPVVITDGGSNADFLDFVQSVPHFTLLTTKGKGVWAQARNSLLTAYQSAAPFIFYTEPDKRDFFQHHLPQWLGNMAVNEATGIITASRSAAAFATFPAFQQLTETTINRCCAEILGADMDYTYGPFLLNRQLVPYLELVREDIGWGWRPYVFGIAKRLGYTIKAITGDYSCPPAQRQDDSPERIYRMRQLSQNMQGLTLSTAIPLPAVVER